MGPFQHAVAVTFRPRIASALAVLATFALFAGSAHAAVYINEILPNPVGTDNGFEYVEIYNSGPNAVDMTGWAIDDAVTIGQAIVRARIPEDFFVSCSTNPVIQPGEFRLVGMQGAQAVLNNTGDDVYLVSSRVLAPTVIHAVTYPQPPGEGVVWAPIPNGTGTFAWRNQTPCASNAPPGDVTAPGTVNDLAAVPGEFPGEIRLTWTAPGDDGNTGTASSYTIKVSHSAINAGNFAAAADLDRWITESVPQIAGTAETLYVFGLATDSTWFFALEAQDEVPNTSAVSNSPGTAPQSGSLLNPDLGFSSYYGNLHSHTSYSDGVGTPTQAYAFARNTAPTPLDFLCVSDHNHSGAGMNLPDYHTGLAEAAAANDDGNFVAIYGQEWGVIESGGHAIVFESPTLFGWEAGNYDVFVAEGDYTGLYTAALANPPASYPPFVEWCHPSSGDFNSFAVTNDGKTVVSLMALITGPAFSTSTTESDVGSTTGNEILFQDALRKGYRVSPAGDQDNHNATWGASTQTRTVALASGKTKSEILNALSIGRNYASQDHNTVVKFSADGHAMGEAWTSATGVRFALQIIDPDLADGIAQIDLLRGITGTSNAVVVATSDNNPNFAWRERQVFPSGTEAHYYFRIRMNDNANIWTGPVYVTYDPSSTVAVAGPVPSPSIALLAAPNPTLGQVTASFALPAPAGHGRLVVFDANGRRVKTLLDGPLAAGEHRIAWSGHDDAGRMAGPGVYFLSLTTESASVAKKILLIR
jgi:flagellar hook assembly protein FlgD